MLNRKSMNNAWLRGAAMALAIAAPLTASSNGAQAVEPELVMQVGITPSDTSLPAQEVRHFGELVDLNTGGKIQVKLFASSLLGKENTQMEGMVSGTHDGFAHVSGYTGRVKEQRFWDLPFLFPDMNAVTRVTQGPLRVEMEEHFRKYGMELIGLWGYGYRQFTGNVRPYNGPEDLKGIKHRIPGGKSKQILFNALGANPSTITFSELYQALKTGVVDSQDNPLSLIYDTKLHEVTKYLSICNYIYNPQIFAVGLPFWKKVPDWAKPLIKQAGRDTEGWSNQLFEELEAKALTDIVAENPEMKINYCPPENLAKWQEVAKPVYDAFIEDTSQEWFDKIKRVAGGGYAN